ncbi:MAG: hypothetical protein GPJ51_07120 [Candidatus Heimdallarchaeota archaeon]|nr:hypothetical protein [Candidatus Heimdallarchaeota archaeon]
MTTQSPNEIRIKGLEALLESLGPAGMLRFLEQFDLGSGDYTKERAKWIKDLDVDTLVKETKGKRSLEIILDIIKEEANRSKSDIIKIAAIKKLASMHNIEEELVDQILEQLKKDTKLYTPRENFVKLI